MKKLFGVRVGRESGQVSIITVVVFILLFSVLTISFSRIMVTASRQAVNDELAASAKAAAESGIEDAKRILSYCAEGASGCEMLEKPIDDSSNTCTTISSNNSLMSALQREVSSGSSVKVGDSDSHEEYLCLKMSMLTPDYLGSLAAGGNVNGTSDSIIIPLKFTTKDGEVALPETIYTMWHNTSSGLDGEATLIGGSDLPEASQWGKTNPAVLRAELVAVPKTGGFTVDSLTANTHAATFRPRKLNSGENINSSIATVATTLQGLLARPSNTNPNDSTASVRLVEIPCEGNSSKNGYACTTQFSISEVAKLSGISIADISSYISNNDYYLRLQTIYNNTHFSISAKDKDDNLIYFDKVQASVDVTGRASDSLKRLSARLDPSNGNDDYLWWPDYAVDSAGRVCKDMTIQAWDGTENCKDTD